jgi:hypothetical protein
MARIAYDISTKKGHSNKQTALAFQRGIGDDLGSFWALQV